MSLVTIQGDANGIGTFTIASPNSNNNRTLNLPDANGTLDRLERAGNIIQVINSQSNEGVVNDIAWGASPGVSALYGALTGGRTYTVAATINITPSSSSSRLLCFGSIGWSSMTIVSTMAFGGIITLNDTTSINTSDYPWYNAPSTFGSGYPPATNIHGMFSPNSTSTQTIRLRPYVYLEANSTSGRVRGWNLTVVEIAG